MKVIEQFLMGKYNDENKCEDGICVMDDFIAVIDGVTSQSNFKYHDKKLGKIITEILIEAIPKLDANTDCYSAIDFLNDYIINFYKEHGIYEEIYDDAANQPAASVIIYSRVHHQIWVIGDCMALYGDTIFERKLAVDELYTKIRKMVIEYLLDTGYTEEQLLEDDFSRHVIKALNKRQPYIRNQVFNSKYDYVTIDGFNKPNKDLIVCIDVPDNVKEIVFTSDGYRKPCPSLKESEDYLQYVKSIDPLGYKDFPYLSGFYTDQANYDDRAYIRFEI